MIYKLNLKKDVYILILILEGQSEMDQRRPNPFRVPTLNNPVAFGKEKE